MTASIGFRIASGRPKAILRHDGGHDNELAVQGRIMNERTRRTFIRAGLIAGASTFAGATLLDAGNDKGKEEGEEEVSPAEDLMREHGVLKRVLLIYGEAIRRID